MMDIPLVGFSIGFLEKCAEPEDIVINNDTHLYKNPLYKGKAATPKKDLSLVHDFRENVMGIKNPAKNRDKKDIRRSYAVSDVRYNFNHGNTK